ncbi:lysophospholipid acyltransferase family protein [Marinoscillum sp. MHG1-6]|uniref:lysophospholipid acyltransferase family protein n=1 Tax=Marinoscillum sp. MHG1-6 TaxID=2959627 RepID=UPI0021579B78|nr:lysophospholipid acyltransferase family protein [Marinoscillum sp. MHG1-6]
MAHPFYLFVKATSWLGLKLFFGGVKLIDKHNIPKDGAVIFAPNHQGAFMDALLSGVYTKRPVHFLTRADIFKSKVVISILKSLHMMPIYRIRDGIQSLSQNDAVFDTCFEILSNGKAVLIFPEGNHGHDYFLRSISKGTSRLALDARESLDPNLKLYIVPIGINYFSHRRPLAKVLIKFGKPIDTSDYHDLYDEHKQRAYNKFREDLTEGMKSTLILAENSEHYEKKRDFIFQPKHQDLPFDQLKEMGNSEDPGVREQKPKGVFVRFLIALFSLPNLPALLSLKKFLPVIKDPVFTISLKYLAGGIFHIIWWILIGILGGVLISWQAGLLFVATAIMFMFARQKLISY